MIRILFAVAAASRHQPVKRLTITCLHAGVTKTVIINYISCLQNAKPRVSNPDNKLKLTVCVLFLSWLKFDYKKKKGNYKQKKKKNIYFTVLSVFLREKFTEPVWHASHLQKPRFQVGNKRRINGGGQNAKMTLQQGP